MCKKIFKMLYCRILRMKFKIKLSGAKILSSLFARDYKKKQASYFKIHQVHKRGFSYSDWTFLGLNNRNYKNYLSTAIYCGMHPINGQYSKWIDDKLTLKYICQGTPLKDYMPEYYYQVDDTGTILRLMDNPHMGGGGICSPNDVANLLREKGCLAIKLMSGSIGEGFLKGEYSDGKYYLNGQETTGEGFCQKIKSLRNYLIIEYLKPHREISEYCSETCNAIRYLIGRMPDGEIKLLKAFIRYGTEKSGFVENYNAGGVLCYIDKNGNFEKGNIIDSIKKVNCIVEEHPDSKKKLFGKIPHWEDIVEAGRLMAVHFPQLKYLGIDFVVTSDEKVKILEINSLTSLDALQLDCSIWDTEASDFYEQFLG